MKIVKIETFKYWASWRNWLKLPASPGLGTDLNPDVLAAYGFQPQSVPRSSEAR